MDGKKFDKNTLKTLIIAASLLLNCILGGASYTYYHHLAEQMNETAVALQTSCEKFSYNLQKRNGA